MRLFRFSLFRSAVKCGEVGMLEKQKKVCIFDKNLNTVKQPNEQTVLDFFFLAKKQSFFTQDSSLH